MAMALAEFETMRQRRGFPGVTAGDAKAPVIVMIHGWARLRD